ncbi:pyrroloquinoline quinone biosynthesis protein PqqB [Hyphomicrobium sp.]|jgi:pyrroloquinoline quinone biosynthesis protein B|uniref:pyrroloquinoline quinone biosynthesis protein PqqB n=1 Tax=Hyphomicrobium sp. TaxID=82 RepID=UPI002BDB1EA1|nr:pyrroloquinoline quinone biosynthesis protein PqqB [Hyphomicrobium sp.]HVZ03687.1 pyrroloquinoline quinone biosynthesis protein PqqB [Hyphomicrobium sp.]
MIIKVLGSAAGGGFPQWNCNGPQSAKVRAGAAGYKARLQSSLAVSADGENWLLLNASPDIRQQINETPELQPAKSGAKRNSPIKAVVVTNADVDHIIGLVGLREGQPFSIYGSDLVLATLRANSVFNVCNPDIVPRIELPLDKPIPLKGAGTDLGITVEAFAVPGKVALFLESGGADANYGSRDGDTIGLKVTDAKTGNAFFYIPGCAEIDAPLAERIRDANLVFFDGTLFEDDEMIKQGLLQKTGKRMGHMSLSGPEGSIAAFGKLNVKRRIYVHINNSNPILDENSEARKVVEDAGWEVGFDGMEVRL